MVGRPKCNNKLTSHTNAKLLFSLQLECHLMVLSWLFVVVKIDYTFLILKNIKNKEKVYSMPVIIQYLFFHFKPFLLWNEFRPFFIIWGHLNFISINSQWQIFRDLLWNHYPFFQNAFSWSEMQEPNQWSLGLKKLLWNMLSFLSHEVISNSKSTCLGIFLTFCPNTKGKITVSNFQDFVMPENVLGHAIYTNQIIWVYMDKA